LRSDLVETYKIKITVLTKKELFFDVDDMGLRVSCLKESSD